MFLQIIIIILATRIAGSIFIRLDQPAVIGEMIAGILLGPSLFGWLAPETFLTVFAPDSLGVLKLFSQIGVCLFMFVVGMELEISHLRHRAHTDASVSGVA
ncbi:MAG TPA: cation:proton antiporter [Chthoniobacterales bacterium]